jgi:hypothetical protein
MDDDAEAKVREFIDAGKVTASQLKELEDNKRDATESLRDFITAGDYQFVLAASQLQGPLTDELRKAIAAGHAVQRELVGGADLWVDDIALKSVVERLEALLPPDQATEAAKQSEPG